MGEITIHPAAPRELAACMALLDPIARYDTLALVARDETGAIAGAGGIGWQSWGNPPGFPAWIQVLPDRQRRGIGRRLASALREAAVGEAPALWAAKPMAIDGVSALFAERMGYACSLKHFFFRADAKRFLERMGEIADKLSHHRRIPPGMRLTRIDRASVEGVCDLVERHVRGASSRLRSDLVQSFEATTSIAAVDIDRSTVLRVDGIVVGALLTKRLPDGENSQIIVRVVAPQCRGGWVNVVLLAETTKVLLADGCRWFEFDCAEDIRDTIQLARRGEADHIRTDGLYRQAVATAI